jgi:cytidine deaminase
MQNSSRKIAQNYKKYSTFANIYVKIYGNLRMCKILRTFVGKLGKNVKNHSIMKELTLQTKLIACKQEELEPAMRQLVEKAKAMTQYAYCPYSHYHVGAAALLEDGQVVAGNNQENAAYPSGLCAERTTLFAANANNPDTPVVAIAVACYTNGHFTKDAASPCGACRQVMVETEHRYKKPMKVLLYGEDMCYVFNRAADLLPLNFDADNLEISE